MIILVLITNIQSMYQLCGNDKMKGVNYYQLVCLFLFLTRVNRNFCKVGSVCFILTKNPA